MPTALDFLLEWVGRYVNPTKPDDYAGAKYLADECMRDAKNAGISEARLIAAAHGDLIKYMMSKLNVAVRARELGLER